MATNLTASCPFDASTFARLSAWAGSTAYSSGLPTAGGINRALQQLGFVQQNDTGQAVWVATVLTCTSISNVSGNTWSIAYSSYTGPAPRVGMSVTFSGFSQGGNNTTLVLTAVSGGASGTVQVTNASGAGDTTGSGTTTISILPTVQATVTNGIYEIWKSIGSLSAFYIKMEYGQCAANVPGFAFTLATGTNGSGTLSGNVSTREFVGYTSNATQGANLFECDFYGDGNKFACIMWRGTGQTFGCFFGWERSLTNTGAEYDTNGYVTHIAGMHHSGVGWHQETLFLTSIGGSANGPRNACVATLALGQATTLAINSNVPILPVFPIAGGFIGNPLTIVVGVSLADVTEGTSFTKNIYGSGSHNYLPTTAAWANYFGVTTGIAAPNWAVAMRFE